MRFIFWLFCLVSFSTMAQTPTVGLFENTEDSYDGYTLFAPATYPKAYLIDNCGRIVREWESDYTRATAAYLTEAGQLLRCSYLPSNFNAGGTAGRLELFDWEGDLTWAYNFSSPFEHQHHDVKPMSNGNILLILWELRNQDEAISEGRDPNLVTNEGVWGEKIMEIKPIGSDSMEIVWEWSVWDHLVQDFDITKLNFGSVDANPQLFNLNFTTGGISQKKDWLHFNSIDYNADLDQILLSSRTWNEIFIIDHSTTTAEAASHSGGNSGKGGDLLYRWGNSASYNLGSANDQLLYGQHDAQWIESALPNAGKILLFNNGAGRPGGNTSSFEIIEPTLANDGSYAILANGTYAPELPMWSFLGGNEPFYSPTTSGVQALPNGNFLACLGVSGFFFEINGTTSERVWTYLSPVGILGPVDQGQMVAGAGVFKIRRYAADYKGLEGHVLTAGLPVELNPYFSDCTLFSAQNEPDLNANLVVFPNPAKNHFSLTSFIEFGDMDIVLYSVLGKPVLRTRLGKGEKIDIAQLPVGIYFLEVNGVLLTTLVKG